MVAAYDPNKVATGTGTTTGAPGSSTNLATKNETKLQVPSGYHSVKKGASGPPAPAYYSLGYMLQQPFGKTTAEVADIQRKLVAGGFLATDAFTNGIYDDNTISAYKDALTSASFYNRQFDQIIQDRVKAGAKPLGGTQGPGPFNAQESSPAEIKAALNDALPNILGHGLTDDELDNVTALYQSLQVKAQRQSYDTNISGGVATAVEPIDVFAQEQAKRLYPNDVQTKSLANVAKQFQSAIASGAPQTATF